MWEKNSWDKKSIETSILRQKIQGQIVLGQIILELQKNCPMSINKKWGQIENETLSMIFCPFRYLDLQMHFQKILVSFGSSLSFCDIYDIDSGIKQGTFQSKQNVGSRVRKTHTFQLFHLHQDQYSDIADGFMFPTLVYSK